ncbi:hypothetical protein L5515_018549 [Caenorhabditis briggsae]|uniref:Peptidase M13 C-terminal domain-containing protein n=1 Tax=Caenorhabditis briggsae TaxID=6238 RepID=A0AAE9FCM3_CAEBR|nr:hypothetical protein L5515_018549 [Caenorhabditis briggsae]
MQWTNITKFLIPANLLSMGPTHQSMLKLFARLSHAATQKCFDTRSEKVFDFGRYTVLGDKGSMLNHNDTAVYFSNDFLLLLSPTHLSDKFGAAGFVFLHEIMHTLVMGPTDFFNPLIPFWKTKSDCVAEQAMKTCTTFPIMGCSPNATFEEDAADMTAYRIAWDFYRKSYTRKTVVKNYESLTKDQLFFYGASVLLCDSRAMTAMKTNEIDPHTNNYQRVNTLMSQMPAFGDAFQCKPTDKMIENKARHCELYGNNAPAVKKRKFSSKR